MITLTAFLGSFSNVRAEEEGKKVTADKFPIKVVEKFKKEYPDAKILGYEITKDGDQMLYEVESEIKGVDRDATHNAKGEKVETEEGIDEKQIPRAVSKTLATKVGKGTIKEATKITNKDGISYEIIFDQKDKHTEYLISEKGKILKSEAEEEDEKEDKENNEDKD